MPRKILRALASLPALLVVFTLATGGASAASDFRAVAIQTVQKRAVGCESCFFFALPTHSPLIQKHDLFVVSTLDRLPPPFWTLAFPKKGRPLILDAQHFDDWNQLIESEKLTLTSDLDVERYVKAYLDLAVGRAHFVSQLLPGELEQVQKKEKGASAKSLQIFRKKEILSVSFYGKDYAGVLKRWDLLLRPDGTIIK